MNLAGATSAVALARVAGTGASTLANASGRHVGYFMDWVESG